MVARILLTALAGTLSLAALAEAQRGNRGNGSNLPQITVYSGIEYSGRSLVIDGDAPDLRWVNFNDQISSIRVEGGQWELCLEPDYRGTCQVISDSLPNMSEWAFNDRVTSIQAVHRPPRDRREGLTLFSGRNYTGRQVTLVRIEDDLSDYSFNDDANSVIVHSGTWTVCEGRNFTGRCVEIDRSSNDLKRFRMDNRISAASPEGIPRTEPDFANPPPGGYRPGDNYQPGRFDGEVNVSGAIPGVGVLFYREPEVNRIPIAACADERERSCGRPAADLLCRNAGYQRSAYHAVQRIPARAIFYLDDRVTGRGSDILVDVLCTR